MLNKLSKKDPEILSSFYLLGKSLIKYKDGRFLKLPDFSDARTKKFSRHLNSFNKVDTLYFNNFDSERFDLALDELKNNEFSAESLLVTKEIDSNSSFLGKISHMKDILKNLSIEYTKMLPIQYHNLPELNLSNLNIILTDMQRSTIDLEFLKFVNEGCSINLSLPTQNENTIVVTFKYCCFYLINKAKCQTTLMYADSITFMLDLKDQTLVTATDKNLFYIQNLANANFKNLKKIVPQDKEKEIKNSCEFSKVTFNDKFASNDIIAIPLIYMKEFCLSGQNELCSNYINSLLLKKDFAVLAKHSKICEIRLNTLDREDESYMVLIQMMPEHAIYYIKMIDRDLNSESVMDKLELFTNRRVYSITLAHEKAIELLLSHKETNRLVTLLSSSSWEDNLRVLEVYCEKHKSCARLLRAITHLYNLRELELKWNDDPLKTKTQKILKEKHEMFESFTRLTVSKI